MNLAGLMANDPDETRSHPLKRTMTGTPIDVLQLFENTLGYSVIGTESLIGSTLLPVFGRLLI